MASPTLIGEFDVVEGRYTGKFSESGKSVDAQMCHIFKLRDGEVTSAASW
jgi:ketosteroid isomerase-like protein